MAYKLSGFTDQWMAAVINAAGYYDRSHLIYEIILSASVHDGHVFYVMAIDDGDPEVKRQTKLRMRDGAEYGQALCDALRVDPKYVYGLTVSFTRNDAVRITAMAFAPDGPLPELDEDNLEVVSDSDLVPLDAPAGGNGDE